VQVKWSDETRKLCDMEEEEDTHLGGARKEGEFILVPLLEVTGRFFYVVVNGVIITADCYD